MNYRHEKLSPKGRWFIAYSAYGPWFHWSQWRGALWLWWELCPIHIGDGHFQREPAVEELAVGILGWSPSSNRGKGRKPRKFLITHKEGINTFYLVSGQKPLPCQKCSVISTKCSRICTNLELPAAMWGGVCLSPCLRKRMWDLTVAHTVFPSCSEHPRPSCIWSGWTLQTSKA